MVTFLHSRVYRVLSRPTLVLLNLIVWGLVSPVQAMSEPELDRSNVLHELNGLHRRRPDPDYLAQMFYPELGDRATIRVMGIGQVSQAADQAVLELPFYPKFEEFPDGVLSQFGLPEPEPLTLDELQPVIDALIDSGLNADWLDSRIASAESGGLPFPFPSTGTPRGALITLTLDDPEIEVFDQAVATVESVLEDSDRIDFGAPQISLEIDNCPILEQQAYQAAVINAQERAEAIATTLDVELSVPAISEPFYSPILSGCYGDTFSFIDQTTQAYVLGMDLSIELIKQLFFTYPTDATSE